MAQLAGAVEYTNCISAEGYDSLNESSGYNTKQSDSEALVLHFRECGVPVYCYHSQVHIGMEW